MTDFDFAWLREVLGRIPHLETLSLPGAVRDWELLSLPYLPVCPRLQLLKVTNPPPARLHDSGGEDRVLIHIGLHRLFGLFGHISCLSMHVADISFDTTQQEPIPDTVISSLRVQDVASSPGELLKLLTAYPKAEMMTTLDLNYVLPDDMSYLNELISLCSAHLQHLCLQLEPRRYGERM